jgi:hypothetical protein
MSAITPRSLAIAGGVMLLVSFVLAAVGDGAADAVAVAVGGIGGVAVVSAIFFAIGESEVRDRERHRHG